MKRTHGGPDRPAQPFILPTIKYEQPPHKPAQLPPTVLISQNEWLQANFPRLLRHMGPQSHQPANTPLTLTILEIPDGMMEVQIHILPALTQDQDLCRTLCSAVHTFYGTLKGPHTFGDLHFSGDQSSARGIAVFQVQTESLKILDELLAETMKFVKFMMTVDGNLERLSTVLLNEDVFTQVYEFFIGADAPFKIEGEPQSRQMISLNLGGELESELLKRVHTLCEAGFHDLALIILSAALKRPSDESDKCRSDFLALYVTLLTSDDALLANADNAQRAVELVGVTLKGSNNAFLWERNIAFSLLPGWQQILDSCVGLFRSLRAHGQFAAAFDLLEKLCKTNEFFTPVTRLTDLLDGLITADHSPAMPNRVRGLICEIVAEKDSKSRDWVQIRQVCVETFNELIEHGKHVAAVDLLEALAETGQFLEPFDGFAKLADRVATSDPSHETIDRLMALVKRYLYSGQDTVVNHEMVELHDWLAAAKDQIDWQIVKKSGARVDLKAAGFTFRIDAQGVLQPNNPFAGSQHGEGLVAYLEAILTGVSNVEMVIKWGQPVLDFLIDHCAELPEDARKRLQACLPALVKVIGKANPAQADAPISRVQRLAQACLLQGVLDTLSLPAESHPSLLRDRNVVAWAYRNRNALFPDLPVAAVDSAFNIALAGVGLDAATAQAFVVDTQAASNMLKAKLAPIAAQLMEPAAIVASAAGIGAGGEAVFQCLKALTFMNDVQWQAQLLGKVSKTIHGAADLPRIEQVAQSAMARLSAHLHDDDISGQDKLHLYGALIDFIHDVANKSVAKEGEKAVRGWAIKALEALAGDDALTHAMEGIEPDARHWPTWAAIELKLGHEIRYSNQCVLFLDRCKPTGRETSSPRCDRVFTKAIEMFTTDVDELGANQVQEPALKLYAMWITQPRYAAPQSIALMEVLSCDTVKSLIRSLITALREDIDIGVTPANGERMLVGLQAQLRLYDDRAAHEQLEKILQDAKLMKHCPVLGVRVCLEFATHYRSIGGEDHELAEAAMFNNAQLMLPSRHDHEAYAEACAMSLRFTDRT